jgi:hypothetical protein
MGRRKIVSPTKKHHIHFKVLKKDWCLRVYNARQYSRRFGSDSIAITYTHDRVVNISPFGRDFETIAHELVHAYMYDLCTASADLDVNALEEIFAELLSKRGYELLRLAKKLVKEIENRKL